MSSSADDDEFRALFGDCDDADRIEQIKNNDPSRDFFSAYIDDLTDAAWERLGSYIAGNDYFRNIDLSECSLGAALFRGVAAAEGGSLRRIMRFNCRRNRGIDSTCFDLLLDSLEGGAVEILNVGGCSIKNPMALARCTLPKLQNLYLDNNGITDLPPEALAKLTHLQSLGLRGNKLGERGFRALADMLRNKECSLNHLQLQSTSMGNTGAIILAESLKCNTKLGILKVSGNRIGDEGMGAFLKLLNDVSSIKSTETSNHTLQSLGFSDEEIRRSTGVMTHVHNTLAINEENDGDPEAAGKAKVLDTQLDRPTREEFARLQGIECPTYHELFSDLDAVLLPDVLALVGDRNYAQNELYPVVVAKASDLVSLIDREAMLRGGKAQIVARIAAISVELIRLNDAKLRIDGQLLTFDADVRGGQISGKKRSIDSVAEN
ncbi:hypothetical protein ACHAXT_012727 [Thalassiosira profunda]